MLRVGRGKPEMRVVGDQEGGPTAARDIAAALWTIAEAWGAGEGVPGIFHYRRSAGDDLGRVRRGDLRAERLGCAAEGGGDRHRGLADQGDAAGEFGARLRQDRASYGIEQPDWRKALDAVVEELSEVSS